MTETMHWENGKLILLDQTKLPQESALISCEDYKRVKEAIKKLEVRGAPAIGAAAAFAMVLGAKEAANRPDFLGALTKIKDDLISARPTAVNLQWGAEKIYRLAAKLTEELTAPAKIIEKLEQLAVEIYKNDIAVNKKIGGYGAEILPDNAVVLTHCNAGALATCGWGTALGVVRAAYSLGKLQMVYADETRPLLQGARLTAYELSEDNIPVTVITDGMAAWTMKTKGINAVVVGADRIAANGDGISIPIEERGAWEVRGFGQEKTVPSKAGIFNPAFDVTPAELITGIITEYGVVKAPYTENIKLLQKHLEEEN